MHTLEKYAPIYASVLLLDVFAIRGCSIIDGERAHAQSESIDQRDTAEGEGATVNAHATLHKAQASTLPMGLSEIFVERHAVICEVAATVEDNWRLPTIQPDDS